MRKKRKKRPLTIDAFHDFLAKKCIELDAMLLKDIKNRKINLGPKPYPFYRDEP